MNEVRVITHGRVNLIGEHTDYNGGFVLPTCIPQFTEVNLQKRDDQEVVALSENFAGGERRYKLGEEKASKHWTDFVQGVTFILAREGHKVSGFEARVRSSVPIGSGLSSSAALEVALLKGLNQLFSLGLDEVQIARLGQMVENDFVGARVGIMDQMVTSLGHLGEALFIDTRTLTVERLPLPLERVDLLVINSGVAHSNAHGDYNQRRAECEAACAKLGVEQLRDLSEEDLERVNALPEPLNRRARHVITENARVLRAVTALKAGDFEELGRLFLQSHASMRDDYLVSVPEIDLLVELCMGHAEVYGARLTGGGFGGSIVALTRHGEAAGIGEKVSRVYFEKTGKTATILVPESVVIARSH